MKKLSIASASDLFLSIRFFYGLLLAVLCSKKAQFFDIFEDITIAKTLWILDYFFIPRIPIFFEYCYFATLIVCILALYFPLSQIFRLLTFVGLFFLMCAQNSQGRVVHHDSILIYYSFALVWPLTGSGLRSIGQFMITTTFTIYVLAGLNKLLTTARAAFEIGSWYPFTGALPNQMAYSVAEGSTSYNFLIDFLIENQFMSAMVWVLAIFLQLAFVFPIFYPKMVRPFIMLIIAFHLGTLLMLGIFFREHVMAVLWLGMSFLPAISIIEQRKSL